MPKRPVELVLEQMSAHDTFVRNLELRRKAASMTKRELVKRSGLSSTFIFEILRQEGSPSLRSLEALAAAVNASLCDLFDEQACEDARPATKRRVAPPGLELVTVALPPEKAFLARRWEADAIKSAKASRTK